MRTQQLRQGAEPSRFTDGEFFKVFALVCDPFFLHMPTWFKFTLIKWRPGIPGGLARNLGELYAKQKPSVNTPGVKPKLLHGKNLIGYRLSLNISSLKIQFIEAAFIYK